MSANEGARGERTPLPVLGTEITSVSPGLTGNHESDVDNEAVSRSASGDALSGNLSRRDLLGLLAAVPLAGVLGGGPELLERAALGARRARANVAATGVAYAPEFFTPEEWRTVRILVDLILPADERSGSATDAGVPEFMDFMMRDRPSNQTPMRGGLAWLSSECHDRFGQPFADCTDAQRKAVLDEIAWPAKARPAMSPGVRFFNMFRDLTASGFFTSEMGVKDLGYIGNVPILEWDGCPDEALRKLGVSYER